MTGSPPTNPADLATVVLPARDEEAALPQVLRRVPPGYTVLVVDNGSRDATAAVARWHGARVVAEPRPGYGAAVHAGLLAARTTVVCFMDADGSVDPAVLPAMVSLLAGHDLVVGRRRPVAAGAWPAHARLANRLLAARVRRRVGVPVRDLAPVRVVRRGDLLDLGVRDRRCGYPLELLVRAGRVGWRVREVDVTYAPRTAGTRSKVSGSALGTLRTVRDMTAVLP